MNLLATQQAAAIAGTRRLVLVPAVISEALFIFADDAATRRVRIDRELLTASGLSTLEIELGEEELVAYVGHASQVDDGEAQAIAVAQARQLPLLSDDNGAIRLAAMLNIEVETTLDLSRAWSEGKGGILVRDAMRSLRRRANYAPPRSHPLRKWYLTTLNENDTG
jgi:predicted nucleic acid-binding protein